MSTKTGKAKIIYGGLAAITFMVGGQIMGFTARDPGKDSQPRSMDVDLPLDDAGRVEGATGRNLARLRANQIIQVMGVELPEVNGFQTRKELQAASERA